MLTRSPRPLSPRQSQIMQYFLKYSAEHGYCPTIREVGDAVGLTSSSTIHGHMIRLVERGHLVKGPDRTTRTYALPITSSAATPFAEQVASDTEVIKLRQTVARLSREVADLQTKIIEMTRGRRMA